MTEGILDLPDGRKLGYALYGPRNGRPVLYFHGTPSSRLEPGLLNAYQLNVEQLLQQRGLKLLVVDRPGMGLSTFNKQGSLLSFASDVAVLLQARNIAACPLMCWSGGGPFALAMARQYSSLISSVYILCGFTLQFTPEVISNMYLNKWYFQSARHLPWMLEQVMNQVSRSNTKHSLPQWLTGLPEPDYELLKKPEQLQSMAALSLKEACRYGAMGLIHEANLYFENFGFHLSEIQQPVQYWWGTQDRSVIRLHMKAVIQQIKNGQVHLKEGEGHISLYVKYFAEVLDAIASGVNTG